MNYELVGKLIVKDEAKDVAKDPEKTFMKRDFVVETSEEGSGGLTFTETIPLQCTGDRVNILDPLNIGDQVNVTFNIKGNKWQKDANSPVRYFDNLVCWKIEKVEGTVSAPTNNEAPPVTEEDDLPF